MALGGDIITTLLVEFWQNTVVPNFSSILLGAAVLVAVILLWIIKDTSRRGANTLVWSVFTVIGLGLLPLIVYFLVRDPLTLDDHMTDKLNNDVLKLERSYYAFLMDEQDRKCPVCGHEVKSRYRFCPACSNELHTVCPACGELMETNWKSCPHCGHKVEQPDMKGELV
ncbi:MAG TPA: zinc ribbon domain-containing protein [Candidatus Cryosericum sp.]